MAEKWQVLTGVPLAVVGEVVFDHGVTTYRSLAPHGDLFLGMVREVVTSPDTYVWLPDGRAAGGPHDKDADRLSAALAQVKERRNLVEVRGRLHNPARTVLPVPPLDPQATVAVHDALIAALANVRPATRSKIEARARAVAESVLRATTTDEVSTALRDSFDGVRPDDPIVEFLRAATAGMDMAIPGPVVGGHPLRWVIENFAAAFGDWQTKPPVR
jgi:hypothetical protein